MGFTNENNEKNKSDSHIHVALHNKSVQPELRDAFLSNECIQNGHKLFRIKSLTKCLLLAIKSNVFKEYSIHYITIAIIICYKELYDMFIIPIELLTNIILLFQNELKQNEMEMNHSEIDNENSINDMTALPTAIIAPMTQKRGGIQLANAILSNNSVAFIQLIESYKQTIDLNYIDRRHGHPLMSLAILTGELRFVLFDNISIIIANESLNCI